jgi:hypothetical protein
MQALSSAYMPIGAILMSQHMFDEIGAHSNKLGKDWLASEISYGPPFAAWLCEHLLNKRMLFRILWSISAKDAALSQSPEQVRVESHLDAGCEVCTE